MATKIYYERFPSGDGELEELGLGNISIDDIIADTEGD